MPVPKEGPGEHIRNALAVLIARKQMAESLWRYMRMDTHLETDLSLPEEAPAIFLSTADTDAIIERLKQALATL